MKKLFTPIAFCAILMLCGCYAAMMGTSYTYDYSMIKNNDSLKTVDTLKTMNFEDEKIEAHFSVGIKSISFTLKNKTNSVMKIVWDEASIVQFGTTHKVMHSGVKYIDRNSSQPSTVIPPLASIDDLVLPSDNVYYREGYYSQYGSSPGGWEEHDLFPTHDLNKPEIKETINNMKGQKITVYLPIVFNEKTLNYSFDFCVSNVSTLVSK